MTPGDKNPHRYRSKTFISAAVAGLIAAGATVHTILDQVLEEKEQTRLVAYQDGKGIWTICKGLTRIFGRPVARNDRLTAGQCDVLDHEEQARSIAEVRQLVGAKVFDALSPPAQAGLVSWCGINLGISKCATSTAIRELRAGRRNEACAAITLWIKDGGKDCRDRANNCAGQVPRRQLEDELCLTP